MIVQNSIPVSRGEHGEHFYIYQGVIDPSILISWLGHDFRSSNWKNLPVALQNLYKQVQRPSAGPRKVHLNEFVLSRMMNKDAMPGLLPPIVVMTETPIRFKSAFEELVAEHPSHDYSSFTYLHATGRLTVDLSVTRMIIDGLVRATVLANMSAEGVKNIPEIGITIYAPKTGKANIEQFEQSFRDLNSAGTQISGAQAGIKDHSNIFGNIAKDILKSGLLTTPSDATKTILKEDHLFRLVRAAFNGVRTDQKRNFLVSPNVTAAERSKAVAAMSIFLASFRRALGDDRFFNPKASAHFFAPSLNAIGLTLHRRLGNQLLKTSDGSIEAVASNLAAIDWRRDNPAFVGLLFDTNGKAIANGGAGVRMLEYVTETMKAVE